MLQCMCESQHVHVRVQVRMSSLIFSFFGLIHTNKIRFHTKKSFSGTRPQECKVVHNKADASVEANQGGDAEEEPHDYAAPASPNEVVHR